jgi:hypothetical protein
VGNRVVSDENQSIEGFNMFIYILLQGSLYVFTGKAFKEWDEQAGFAK